MILTKAETKKLFGKVIVPINAKGIVKKVNDFDNFEANDWLKYFIEKAKEKGVKYQVVRYKDISIIKAMMKNYSNTEIRNLIDFLWDSDFRFQRNGQPMDIRTYGVFLLSNAWVSGYFNLAMDYAIDKKSFSTKGKQRGWVESGKDEVSISF